MPGVAGHELPTPGNADSAEQKKHREQVIAAGTLLLVVLTLILVVRHGTNSQADMSAPVTSDPNNYDPNAFSPSTSGGGGAADPYSILSQQIGQLPGQILAILPRSTQAHSPATATHKRSPAHSIGVSVHAPIHIPRKATRRVAPSWAKRGKHPPQLHAPYHFAREA